MNKLSKNICKRCLNEAGEKGHYRRSAGSFEKMKTRWDSWDGRLWNAFQIDCPYQPKDVFPVSTVKEPPEWCKYTLEHLMERQNGRLGSGGRIART